jgi:hypothetical protein
MNYDSESPQFFGSLIDRFPASVNGYSSWQQAARTLPTDIPQFSRVLRPLVKPCVFVSYKSQDRQFALRLAYLCNQEGFEYWLDVLDPNLASAHQQLSSTQRSVLIATILEMALLNATHLIAAITNQSASSRWVPYEFGRVKDQAVVTDESCSWLHPNLSQPPAEYLYLCAQHPDEAAVINWLTLERSKWQAHHGGTLPCPASPWTYPVPAKLP